LSPPQEGKVLYLAEGEGKMLSSLRCKATRSLQSTSLR